MIIIFQQESSTIIRQSEGRATPTAERANRNFCLYFINNQPPRRMNAPCIDRYASPHHHSSQMMPVCYSFSIFHSFTLSNSLPFCAYSSPLLVLLLPLSTRCLRLCPVLFFRVLLLFSSLGWGPLFSFSASPLAVPSPGPPGTVPYCFFPFLKTPDSVKLNLPHLLFLLHFPFICSSDRFHSTSNHPSLPPPEADRRPTDREEIDDAQNAMILRLRPPRPTSQDERVIMCA